MNDGTLIKLAELLLLAARVGTTRPESESQPVAAEPAPGLPVVDDPGVIPPATTIECPCGCGFVEASAVLANGVVPVLLATCPRGNQVLAIPETNYAVCRVGEELVVLDGEVADA